MNLEIKDKAWLLENINLHFSDNMDEKFSWAWSYNRLTDSEKDEICEYLKK